MVAGVEKVVLCLAGKSGGVADDADMAGLAGAAAATDGEQFVETRVANDLHDAGTCFGRNCMGLPLSVDDRERRHR